MLTWDVASQDSPRALRSVPLAEAWRRNVESSY